MSADIKEDEKKMAKNVLIITDIAPGDKSGCGTNGNMHCRMICSMEELNVYSMYITNSAVQQGKHNIRIYESSKAEKLTSVLSGYPPYLNRRVRKSVFRIILEKKISIVYLDNSVSGKLIEDIKRQYPEIKIIAFFHDIEAIKMKEEKNSSLIRKLILPVFYKNERFTASYSDKTIVLNERDKNQYEKEYKKVPDAIVPISIPEVTNLPFDVKHSENEKLSILFVGVEYGPNLSGVRWFLNNVLPCITCDFEFNIVGYNMEKYRTEFEEYSDKVHVIGTVESLREWYTDADLIIAPIFEGGGMKVKTAEALSYGKHFVGCTESLEGYWEGMPKVFWNKKIFKCDDPKDFAKAINRLANEEFYINDREIKDWADLNYSYQANLKKYRAIFESI